MASNEALNSIVDWGDQLALEWLRAALGLQAPEAPFPWQLDLLRRFRQGQAVSSLDLPTGLGKTAVMAVWLVARALGATLPRRLVYVVDRRAVVDQATEVAEALCAWVAKEQGVANALGLEGRPLPISTLRGQHVDNRAWLEDPSAPAIIVGTVDMVGSRLLFSGYGVSSKMRPYHAGLLGADTLVVLDEAHLAPAFEDLLRQIERGADAFGPKEPSLRGLVPEFKLLSLSATARGIDGTRLTLSDDDRSNATVKKRLSAKKALRIVDLTSTAEANATPPGGANADDAEEATKKNKGPKLAGALAKQAWEVTTQGSAQVRCLVFCNARKDATAVANELRNLANSAIAPDPTIELFVGGRRVKERTEARDALARLGFLAGIEANLERSAFLIATSAGEVGVDLDADHMVSDLVAWERMVQRLGRVNRRGSGNATVVVVVDREPEPSESTTKALEKKAESEDAKRQLGGLTMELFALQGAKPSVPRGQKQSADDKATEESRRHAEKKLKESISKCQKRIKAFKDADAKVVARHEAAAAQHRALRKLLAAVGDHGSLSPDALLTLREREDLRDALRDATTVEVLRPELTRPLVDAWSMTSLDVHPGRPEIDPWLRGFRPDDPPQTTVVWRRHLPVRADGSMDAKAATRFFESAPPHTSEQLETETHLVLEWLIERALAIKPKASKTIEGLLEKRSTGAELSTKQRNDLAEYLAQVEEWETRPQGQDFVAVVLSSRGDVKGACRLDELKSLAGEFGKKGREQLKQMLVGTTLVIDARLGGLQDGLLDPKATQVAATSDDGSTSWLARPDVAGVPVTGFRVRTLGANEEDVSAWSTTPGAGWVRRHLFVTNVLDGEPSAALVIDGWAGEAASEEERAEANRPQPLDEHQSWAEDCARQIAQRLGIETARANLLALAARLHDEGKRSARWQRAFKAPVEGRPYAKTKGPIDFDLLDGYRHELGSLPYVEAHLDFKSLGTDDQDFVLHLIAAHHGFARPVIGTRGCDDAPPHTVDERARTVALRFARLSRRWGPWGLAWWESLLRSADQTASRLNQQASTAKEGQP
jgi:CRISPR-associated endonuclease/helicase Cas3